MVRKISFVLLWLGFLGYAFLLAPPDRPDTFELIKNLSTGQWTGINPLIVSLFNIMGILPLIYASILPFDGRGQKVRAWPFLVTSFAVGAFAILPYLFLREPNPKFTGEKNLFLKIMDSRFTAILITLGALYLLSYGLLQGNWSEFALEWRTSRFIHVMSLDFCLLCALFPTLVKDDLARREVKDTTFLFALTFIPLLGPLLYLCLRPSQLSNASIATAKTA